MLQFDLSGRRALVTGSTQGIGYAIASCLAEHGAEVYVHCSRDTEKAQRIARQIEEKTGAAVHGITADLGDADAAQQLFDFCKNQNAVIDILINNAGMFFFHELDDEYHTKMELMLNLHIMTPTHMCRIFGNEMKKRGYGFIILVSSMAARLPYPGITIYSATKAYLKSFGKSFYYEMRDYGVGVTTVCPGAIATPLYKINPRLLKLGVNLGVVGTPQWLVKKALKGMFKKKMVVAPGAMNVYLPPMLSLLPKRLVNSIWRKVR